MAHHPHHRSLLHHSAKEEEEGGLKNVQESWLGKKARPSFMRLLFLLFLLFSFILLVSRFHFLFLSNLHSGEALPPSPSAINACSLSSPLCCDRADSRADVCFLNGDIRTRSGSFSFVVFSNSSSDAAAEEERIRPYTRKWESPVMSTIDELRLSLRTENLSASAPTCDVRHDVPAVVFSTGGYTGNVYHEFNDGLIPLYLTARRFNRRVVFVILEYHDWWVSKYSDVLSVLSDHPAIDYSADGRTHCFPQTIVGLQIHGELSIDGPRTDNGESMADFRRVLDEAYRPRIQSIPQELAEEGKGEWRPKLVIICRNGSRTIENEAELAAAAEEVGFRVELMRPSPTTEMAKIYRALNSSDAVIGVHGAAMTHLLFMRPGAVLVQIVPLGLEWAAEAYYGQPAARAGLRYERYGILARESSLSREYGADDAVLRNPESVNAKGWEVTKKVYLDGQRVRLDLARFRRRLLRAHRYLVSKRQ